MELGRARAAHNRTVQAGEYLNWRASSDLLQPREAQGMVRALAELAAIHQPNVQLDSPVVMAECAGCRVDPGVIVLWPCPQYTIAARGLGVKP